MSKNLKKPPIPDPFAEVDLKSPISNNKTLPTNPFGNTSTTTHPAPKV